MADDGHRAAALGRTVRGRSVRRAGGAVASRSTSTGGSRRTTSPRAARTPACCTVRACSTTTSWLAMLGALDDLEADVRLRRVRARRRRRGRPHGARARARRAARQPRRQAARRPLPQRPGGDRLPAVPARPRARSSPAPSSTCSARLLEQAGRHVDTAAPGFTHLQHAQPVSFGHELAKHVHALAPRRRPALRLGPPHGAVADGRRRARRLVACRSTRRPSPPSSASAALWRTPSTPSATATSSAEFCFVAAMVGVHLSRLGEEICLWTSREFGWAQLDDAWSTGSSIMPQKKNPDVAELARGKAGRLIGDLTACSRCSRACRSPTTATCRRTRSRCSTPSTRCCSCCPP